MANHGEQKATSGFGTASLVLGILAIVFSFIPVISYISFILGILAIIFGIVSLCKGASKGLAIAGIIISIIAVYMAYAMHKGLETAVDEVGNSINQITGGNTEQVLQDDFDVNIGKFEVEETEYGLTNTKLTVTVKNKASEMKSGNIQIEAVNADGSRIANDYIYINSLNAGQSQNFDVFTLVSSDDLNAMKNATFKIVEASTY